MVVAVLSLFIIFFVGREFNPETWSSSLKIVNNGLQHFRQGLDVSGGTRLIYKVNYDKYDQLYDNPAELTSIKKMIENIILQNIDKRVSWLWVSDYKPYTKKVDDENFIVIELGGIANLDEAKDIIGKTVELEFRLPNDEEPSQTEYDSRKVFAKELLNEISDSPDMMEQLSDSRQSEWIYYNLFSGINYEQLPQIYRNNSQILSNLKKWEIYPGLLEWLYTIEQEQDELGNIIDHEIEWFSFFRILDVVTQERVIVQATDLLALAKAYNISFENKPIKWQIDIPVGNYEYNTTKKQISYHVQIIAQDQEAYFAEIYLLPKASWLWLSEEEITSIDSNFTADLDKAEKAIIEGKDLSVVSELELLNEGWVDLPSLAQTIPGFSWQEAGVTKSYENAGGALIVKVIEKKETNENLSHLLVLSNVSTSQWKKLENDLEMETLYTIEDVFIQDRETRIPAVDEWSNRVLNGAYFKYANKTTSQIGEPVVVINFDSDGKDLFCKITERNIGTQMAIFVWWKLLTSPVIRDKICGGTAQIDGGFTSEWAQELVNWLNEWTLPAPLVLMQEEKVSPTLWYNALRWALIAGLVGIIIIFFLMRFMYWYRKAIVTLTVLVTFLIVLLAVMKLINTALSLSGIAAVVLSIGMWVDANILIFERIREELKEWKTMKSAIETGYTRSLPAIRDGNVSTLLIAFLLFAMGINMFKWFGSMMILNIILILFLNVPLTKELLSLVFHNKKEFSKKSKMDKQINKLTK